MFFVSKKKQKLDNRFSPDTFKRDECTSHANRMFCAYLHDHEEEVDDDTRDAARYLCPLKTLVEKFRKSSHALEVAKKR